MRRNRTRALVIATAFACVVAFAAAGRAQPSTPVKSPAAPPLTRMPVSDTDPGHKAHIFLSVPAEKQFRAAHPVKGSPAAGVGFNGTTNMLYNGGPVMRNPTNYLIFWQPPGRAAFPAGYQLGIEKFFQNVGGTPFYNIASQYNDTTGLPVPDSTSLGAPSFTDTTTAPPSGNDGTVAHPLTDGDIQNEVTVARAANPAWLAPSNDVEYFVFTPSDVDECFNATNCFAVSGEPHGTFCAYHTFFNGNTIYAYMPFASVGSCYGTPTTFPNGATLDVVISPASHEMLESNTDPLLNAWQDVDGLSGEIGDKCAYNYGYVPPDGTNMVLNGNRFQIQQEWSNDITGCAKRYGAAPATSVPASVAFGEVEGGSTAEKDVVIQNNAAGDLNILNIRLGPGSDPAYSLLNVPPSAATLHSSESLIVQVQFAPSAGAAFGSPTASVIVDTDDPAQTTYTTNVTGQVGVAPVANCAPAAVNTDPNLCSAANASINAGSSDPDGEPITLTQSPAGPYTLGTTAVTLTVTDTPGLTASCASTITVSDHQLPTITCPAPQSVQCTGTSGAMVALNPTFSDNCPGVSAVCVPPSGSTFGFGSTPVTCTATDGSGNTASCGSSVTVTDVPPVIQSVVASPNVLRPPNKKLDPVTIIVKDTDTCDPAPVCSITGVATQAGPAPASSFAITGPLTLKLRANGNGGHALTYVVSVTCADSHGGSTVAQTTVQAPL